MYRYEILLRPTLSAWTLNPGVAHQQLHALRTQPISRHWTLRGARRTLRFVRPHTISALVEPYIHKIGDPW